MSAPYDLSEYEWSNYDAIKFMYDYAKNCNWKCDPQFIFFDKYENMRSYPTLKCKYIKLINFGKFIYQLQKYLPLIIFIGSVEYTRKTIDGKVTIAFDVNYLCNEAFMYISKSFGKSDNNQQCEIANKWYKEGARFSFVHYDNKSIYNAYNDTPPILSWVINDKNEKERELLYASIYIHQSKYFYHPNGLVSNIFFFLFLLCCQLHMLCIYFIEI